jgi:hypothetical protein
MLVTILVGCANSEEIDQLVEGTVVAGADPKAGLAVSVVQSIEPNACDGAKGMAETDSNGHFALYRKAKVGRFAVLVQRDTLCIFESGAWHSVWRSLYGPAAPKMTFSCTRSPKAWNCTMDGHPSMP